MSSAPDPGRDLDDAIAVVGLSCRFGSAGSADSLWRLLADGRSAIRRHSRDELLAMGHRPETLDRPEFQPVGVALADADCFDAQFFGYSPVHAEWLDPQQRVLLETAWHALEDAGYRPDRTGLHTAAFVSVGQPSVAPVGITELDAAGMIRFSSADKDFAASRISYKLGLTGPSLTVQTACSSGLVAVHLAVESLLSGESDLALVGAASLHFPQAGYLAAPDMILSPSGGCRPFDDTADGTVFGNGAATVVLRRLADAIADGDPIRAVVRGSAVNNDGARKMDYHAPSPEGQQAVLREALAVARIDPATVGYLEAHGTGTPLGDPIEFAALDRVYGAVERQRPAAVGSVKSVLGHLNTAAGLAGLIKVVLCLEHGSVPAQAPFSTPNRALTDSAGLRIADSAPGWPGPDGEPRRAAVSSFGIGGTNAHVVLEQAPDLPARQPAPAGQRLWALLSADTEPALRATLLELADALDRAPELRLADVVHTLSGGRGFRALRVAVPAGTTAELAAELRVRATTTPIATGHAADEAIQNWLAGGDEPPEQPVGQARRVSLPGYRFARKRWPLPTGPAPADLAAPSAEAAEAAGPAAAVPTHRLVRPDSPLVADHVVAGVPVLPAAAQLDLALAAVGRPAAGDTGLADVVFGAPVQVLAPVRVHAELDGEDVRVISTPADQDATGPASEHGDSPYEHDGSATKHVDSTYMHGGSATEHATARLLAEPAARPAPLAVTDRDVRFPEIAEPSVLYRYFSSHGVGYGPAFQVLRELRYGDAGVLARVSAGATEHHGFLSPYVLDGALQSVIGCLLGEDLGGETYIPFAIDEFRLFGRVPDQAWVWARPQRLAGGGRRVRKFDVSIADDAGTVQATLSGLALRPVGAAAVPGLDDVSLFTVRQRPVTVPDRRWQGPVVWLGNGSAAARRLAADSIEVSVLAAPASADDATLTGERIADALDGDQAPAVVWPIDDVPDAPAVTEWAVRVSALLRALLRPLARRGAHLLLPYRPADRRSQQVASGLAALGRSMRAENPRFSVTAVAVPEAQDVPDTVARLLPALAGAGGGATSLLDTELVELALPTADRPALRTGGRYWINGAGRLSYLLADHLLRRYGANLVITGRSELRGERAEDLRKLTATASGSGGSVEYYLLDTCNRPAVTELARRLRTGGRAVHGVFHCAGTLRDSYLLRKQPEAVREVVDPKVVGADALEAATADWPLDLFVLFSSVSGALGSAGQSDYAFANAAMDELARQRAADPTRSGRTLSVAWPLWEAGGMQPPPSAQDLLDATGIRALPTTLGLHLLEVLFSAPDVPVVPVLLHGDRDRLNAAFAALPARSLPAAPMTPEVPAAQPAPAARPAPSGQPAPVAPSAGSASAPDDDQVSAAVLAEVTRCVAEATRTPESEIDADRLFDDLGIDSLLAIRVVDLLGRRFGRLSKTLLFECRSVQELAEHLQAECGQACAALVGPAEPGPAELSVPAEQAAAAEPVDRQPVSEPGPVATAQPAGPGVDIVSADGVSPVVTGQNGSRAIAIIGVAGRFPQAADLDELWQNLLDGRDSIVEVPPQRWDAAALYDTDKTRPDRTYTKWGGFLDGVTEFDPALFNISPREAGIIDPQARLFLQTCWAALDDSGYAPDRLVPADDQLHRRDVGVFVGAMYGDYQLHEAEERLRGNPILADSAYWSIANRVSYFFDFQGPSVAVDTACSSALTAVHMAVESLRAGSSRVAIAGGVNVSVHPNKYLMLGQGRFASSDGRCRSFGAGGDGYVPGEGVGAVVLKPLADALRDGDHIHGVIRGSAVNHGGRTNGYTVPNPRAQADLITKALADAELSAADLDYLEAHGTGTSLGDPIEVRGLVTAFGRDGVREPGRVPIGSVKSNVGHLESAAGVVALAKVLLQLRHRTLVPSLHATPANPEIDFDSAPLRVQQEVAEWRTVDGTDRPLRAGISSFGAGGANAHLIVEGPPVRPAAPPRDEQVVLLLSARTDQALVRYAGRLADAITAGRLADPALTAADVAYTFAVGRSDLARRVAIAGRTLDELLTGLAAVRAGNPVPPPAGEPIAAWLSGKRIDRAAACGADGFGRRIPLPHYPFDKVRCWYDLQIAHLAKQGRAAGSQPHQPDRPHLRDFDLPAAAAGPAPVEAAPAQVEAPVAAEPVRVEAAVAPAPARVEPAVAPVPARPTPPPAPSTPAAVRLRPVTPSKPATGQEPDVSRTRTVSLRSLHREAAPAAAPVPAPPAAPVPAAQPPVTPAPIAPAPVVPAPVAQVPVAQPPAAQPVLDTRAAPAAAPNSALLAEVEADISRLLCGVLYLEPDELDTEQTFQEIGVDSILGVEFVAAVNAERQLDIKATALYDHPTPKAFAALVTAELAPAGSQPAAASPQPSQPAAAPGSAGLEALLDAVRNDQLTVEQALSRLQQLSPQSS